MSLALASSSAGSSSKRRKPASSIAVTPLLDSGYGSGTEDDGDRLEKALDALVTLSEHQDERAKQACDYLQSLKSLDEATS